MIGFVIGVILGVMATTAFFLKNAKALPTLEKVVEEIEKAKQGLMEAGDKSSAEVQVIVKSLTENIKAEMESSGLEAFLNQIVQKIKAKVTELAAKAKEKVDEVKAE